MTNLILRSVRASMKDSPTYLEILEEGEEKGLQKGLEMGTARGMQSAVLLQGERRFGRASETIRRRVLAINDHDALDSLLLRLLDVSTWDELLQDLGPEHPPDA